YSIYDGPPYTSAVSNQPAVTGSNWIDFVTGGKLIASINPNGQNLGSTDAQAYIYTGAFRINTGQYYHNRNITIKPATVNLPDSATVRFYFLDSETEALINATGCTVCSKPSSAYELGVTKYSNVVDAVENGSLADNTGGNYLFIIPANVKKVPFDKGYYAEFKVKDFSEFWLNDGGPNNDQALPVELISFTAKKNSNNNVDVEWITGSENNASHFDVELAKGNEEYRQNHFVKIGDMQSQGNSAAEQYYRFTDEENNKQGVRYYRLKMVDHDGTFTYSPVRSVVFDEEIKWQVYPNPSPGLFNLVYQADEGETVTVKIYDVNGKLVHQVRLTANAFIQKTAIDLSGPKFTAGMYMLEVTNGDKKHIFRLLKK
ncbi:MAG TPA: T9SS type A sorting domain-containing protein, partial [Chitinophagaceae bacterium]|nr:T9SS type A sorting domain-containing protein [Chitinophagaceae bacterium]